MNQPLAYVHPGAKIAKNVTIEPFAMIHNNVEIGEGTWIGSNVTIMEELVKTVSSIRVQ
jgi:UDP-N-acetylglucosamine acyltransferase